MASKEINLTNCDQNEAQCHLMPCRIEHNNIDIKAREYFWPTIRTIQPGGDDEQGREEKHNVSLVNDDPNNPTLTASFRGRPLQGRKIKLPDGFKGYAVGKSTTTTTNTKGADKTKVFDEFTYWNWDELPGKQDAVVKALDWINLSKAIHNPVE